MTDGLSDFLPSPVPTRSFGFSGSMGKPEVYKLTMGIKTLCLIPSHVHYDYPCNVKLHSCGT